MADPLFADVVALVQANLGLLTEATGLPLYEAIGDGEVSATQSKFGGYSFYNPGTSTENADYLRLQDAYDNQGLFVFPGQFTWEGWFYVDALGGDVYHNIFANRIDYPDTGFVQLAIINDGTRYVLFNSSVGNFVANIAVPLQTWAHIAITRDASNVVRVFVNGVVAPSYTGSNTCSGTAGILDEDDISSFDVGRGQAADNADLNCYFDQVRITKSCRYTAAFTPPTAPFEAGAEPVYTTIGVEYEGVVWWPFLDLSTLGGQKDLEAIDLVATAPSGVTLSVGWNQKNRTDRTPEYETTDDTLTGTPVPFPASAPSYDLRLTFAANQVWEWNAANIYYL